MTPSPVVSVVLPSNSRLSGSYDSASFSDAFAVSIPQDMLEPDTAARLILTYSPFWLRGLLTLRDAVVLPLGLKTTTHLRQQLEEKKDTDRIGFFPILSRHDNEIIAGLPDKHLDFKVSILMNRHAGPGVDQVIATTVVKCNNWTGELYIRAIGPFHKLVVCSELQNLARHFTA